MDPLFLGRHLFQLGADDQPGCGARVSSTALPTDHRLCPAAEVTRLAPLIREGGYVPFCDHHIPPDVPLAHFQYYLATLREVGAIADGQTLPVIPPRQAP